VVQNWDGGGGRRRAEDWTAAGVEAIYDIVSMVFSFVDLPVNSVYVVSVHVCDSEAVFCVVGRRPPTPLSSGRAACGCTGVKYSAAWYSMLCNTFCFRFLVMLPASVKNTAILILMTKIMERKYIW